MEEESKNKTFGWLFICYPVICYLPVIIGLILASLGLIGSEAHSSAEFTSIEDNQISHYPFFIQAVYFYLRLFSFFSIYFILPICIVAAGVLLLKNKKSGIKMARVAFLTDFIFRFFFLFYAYYTVAYILLDAFMFYYLTKHKDKILA